MLRPCLQSAPGFGALGRGGAFKWVQGDRQPQPAVVAGLVVKVGVSYTLGTERPPAQRREDQTGTRAVETPEERLRGLRGFTSFTAILRASPGRAPEEGITRERRGKTGEGTCGKARPGRGSGE